MKRSIMLDQLTEQAAYLRGLLTGLSESQLSRHPAPGKMSLRQCLGHLAHTNELFAERLKSMLTLDRPPVRRIDASLEDLESYQKLDVERALEKFEKSRAQLVERLARIYPGDWEREASHPEYRHFNVQTAVELLLLHEAHHLYGMERMRAALDRWDER